MPTNAVLDGRSRLSYRGPSPILIGKALGVAVTVVGLVVLAGWLLGVPALVSLGPGWVPMTSNAALGLLLSGVALTLASAETTTWAKPARLALAGAVLTLGAATLAEHAFGWGRPSFVASLNFMLVGAALLALDAGNGWRVRPSELLSLAMGFLAFVALEGYVSAGARCITSPPSRPWRCTPRSRSSRSPSGCSSSAPLSA